MVWEGHSSDLLGGDVKNNVKEPLHDSEKGDLFLPWNGAAESRVAKFCLGCREGCSTPVHPFIQSKCSHSLLLDFQQIIATVLSCPEVTYSH